MHGVGVRIYFYELFWPAVEGHFYDFGVGLVVSGLDFYRIVDLGEVRVDETHGDTGVDGWGAGAAGDLADFLIVVEDFESLAGGSSGFELQADADLFWSLAAEGFQRFTSDVFVIEIDADLQFCADGVDRFVEFVARER